MALKIDIEAPVNGRLKATVKVENGDGRVFTDKADLTELCERQRLSKIIADRFSENAELVEKRLEELGAEIIERRKQPDPPPDGAVANELTTTILDAPPPVIRRPSCLIGGRAFAAAWLIVQTEVRKTTDPETGKVLTFDPPRLENASALAVIREDGVLFADGVPEARPLAELGIDISLPSPIPANRAWTGAGVKRFLKGERPDPADVFHRVIVVVDAFMDFGRSLAPQGAMCELIGCYVLATYLLDAFDVIGYVWPNGDRGAGKTNLLLVVCEMAFLGQVILAGGSYASLRDLADYGAALGFDDAEGIADVKKSDPDKRALLLAGNRRGATITVKEQRGDKTWVTRYIDAFSPRLFSAIRLPDAVLSSRTLIVPLVRSSDQQRAKKSPLDHEAWPCNHRQLVDDLWALGLANLSKIRAFDDEAARRSALCGRLLEPWRGILAVALWLQESHGVVGLFDRMRDLAMKYQSECGEFESTDPVRVAIKSLRRMVEQSQDPSGTIEFQTRQLVGLMNAIASEDELTEGDKEFISSRRVGWLLKRLRFEKSDQRSARGWKTTRDGVEALAQSYGMLGEAPCDQSAQAQPPESPIREPASGVSNEQQSSDGEKRSQSEAASNGQPQYWTVVNDQVVETTVEQIKHRIRAGESPAEIRLMLLYYESEEWKTARDFSFSR